MAKTKTVKQKAWGVFTKEGELTRQIITGVYRVMEKESVAKETKLSFETVRPVTISWEVDD